MIFIGIPTTVVLNTFHEYFKKLQKIGREIFVQISSLQL